MYYRNNYNNKSKYKPSYAKNNKNIQKKHIYSKSNCSKKEKTCFKLISCLIIILFFLVNLNFNNSMFSQKLIEKTKIVLNKQINIKDFKNIYKLTKNIFDNIKTNALKIVNGKEQEIFVEDELIEKMNSEIYYENSKK